jgi:23S rRNA (uracil1939-C5)-methyltransferase
MKNYCRPEPIIAMEEPFYYRNKIHAAFGENRRHEVISGIYEQKSHRIVPVDSCLIENRKADEIVISIRGLLKSFKIRPYNEDSGYGLLRHVLIRVGHVTGQIMVVLVLSSPIMPSKNNFVKALRKLHPEITTIVVNVNDQDTSMVLGEREQVIYGKGYIEDELCGKTFRISPKSFYQVNPVQTEKLYNKAMEYAKGE